MWTLPEATEVAKPNERRGEPAKLTAGDCNSAKVPLPSNKKKVEPFLIITVIKK
jgi:hypothetical protein